MRKRIFSAICIVMLLSVFTTTAFASESIDMSRTGSIYAQMKHQGTTVGGGSLTLYYVAEINGIHYSYVEEFSHSHVSLGNIRNADTAKALADYARGKNLSGTKVQIDKDGKVSFPNLNLGLYLLIQEEAAPGYDTIKPFLVTVPARSSGKYQYDVNAMPKLSLEPKPTTPTTPTTPTQPTPPAIPQTGLNQWPVPVLASGGLLLLALGLMLYTSGKKHSHEN